MSSKELAKSLIDQIPESKMFYIIAYLQGAAIPEELPNAETLASINELEQGGGTVFTGSTEDLFAKLMEGQLCLMYDIPPDSKRTSRPV